MNGGRIDRRLTELGLELPEPFASVANYVPFTRQSSLLFVAGQGPVKDGKLVHVGKLGGTLDLATGQAAARLTALNIIAQVKRALDGDLDRVTGCVRLFGLINSVPGFTALPAVMDGASALMVDVFGERGRHARTTIGAHVLPHEVAIEIEALFAVS